MAAQLKKVDKCKICSKHLQKNNKSMFCSNCGRAIVDKCRSLQSQIGRKRLDKAILGVKSETQRLKKSFMKEIKNELDLLFLNNHNSFSSAKEDFIQSIDKEFDKMMDDYLKEIKNKMRYVISRKRMLIEVDKNKAEDYVSGKELGV